MKIIYEFGDDDEYRLNMFNISSKMYMSLCDIDRMIRDITKYDREVTLEKFCDEISELIYDSGIREIE